MAKLVLPRVRNLAYLHVGLPLAIMFIVGFILLLCAKPQIAYTLWLGGLVWFIPTLYFAYKIFYRIETDAKLFIINYYIAQFCKLVLVVICFISVLIVLHISFLGLLTAYLGTQALFWIIVNFKIKLR